MKRVAIILIMNAIAMILLGIILQYVECLTFNKKDVFIDLCNQKELRKVLKTRIEMYDKSIREKY